MYKNLFIKLKNFFKSKNSRNLRESSVYSTPPAVDVSRVREALAVLDAEGASETPTALDEERPVFILGVGWRVGSTLLQRICCTDRSLLIWGEPLGNMGIINRITEAICIIRSKGWPFQEYWLSKDRIMDLNKAFLYTEFIANLYPAAKNFRLSLQQWVYHWLGQPALDLGFTRWGLKETRLAACDALLLNWLFPKAAFLPIIRHPVNSYRSCKDAGGQNWVEPRTNNPISFSKHWNRLAMSWLNVDDSFPFIMIKYEELISGKFNFTKIKEITNLDVRPELALSVKAGSTTAATNSVSDKESRILYRSTREGMKVYNYSIN